MFGIGRNYSIREHPFIIIFENIGFLVYGAGGSTYYCEYRPTNSKTGEIASVQQCLVKGLEQDS